MSKILYFKCKERINYPAEALALNYSLQKKRNK